MALRALPRVLLATFALASAAPPAFLAAGPPEIPPRTVLTLYWSSESFSGTHDLDAVIQQGLRSNSDRIDYFAEYLESDRFPEEEATQAFCDYIRRKYRSHRIDVVIAVTQVALQFALRYRAELFPEAAVVFSATAAPDAHEQNSGRGITGMVNSAGFGETLQLALKLHPSTARVFVVAQ